MSAIKYSIVIPCYTSASVLEELTLRIVKIMERYGAFEVIFVNDQSPDIKTWETIEKLAGIHSFVRGIDLLYNVGQFRATLCGLENAQGEFVITMDDDLQHPPEEIPKLIETMKQNPSMDCII
ncbi:MAG: glycosyltransferase [Desulfobacterales bacterium]|nr:glycosyltransferase [Desulfobacterales bacterium]